MRLFSLYEFQWHVGVGASAINVSTFPLYKMLPCSCFSQAVPQCGKWPLAMVEATEENTVVRCDVSA